MPKNYEKFPAYERFQFASKVKFTDAEGKVYYGEIQDPTITFGAFHAEALAAADRGMAFIKDAVTTKTYLFPPEQLEIIPHGKFASVHRGQGYFPLRDNEYDRYQADAGNAAIRVSEGAGGQVTVGAMFQIPTGDGYAVYVVEDVRGSNCLIDNQHFGGDDYYDHRFGLGGWFSKKEIAPYVKRWFGLRQMFSKPK